VDAGERRRQLIVGLRTRLAELRERLRAAEDARDYQEIMSEIGWVSHQLRGLEDVADDHVDDKKAG
jgi:hypothetical protein